MAERSPWLEPVNLGLGVAIGLSILAAGAAALGPGRAQLADVRAELASGAERIARWREERSGLQPVGSSERERWARQWRGFVARIPAAVDDPALLARLASAFQGPGVHNLEIDRLASAPGLPEPERLSVSSPSEAALTSLEGDPVRVHFRADYAVLARVLRDVESGELPVRLEALEVRRGAPGLAVELTLSVFARREGAS